MFGSGRRSLPSPAIVVAAVAIVAALAGTALAGTDASSSAAVTKKKVKKIATKQVEQLAPELSVANAETVGGVGPSGFVSSDIVARFRDKTIPSGEGGDQDASCAAGEQIVGGGVVFPGFASDTVTVVSSRPNAFTQGASFDSWHGSGRNNGPDPKTLRVYAVCAQ